MLNKLKNLLFLIVLFISSSFFFISPVKADDMGHGGEGLTFTIKSDDKPLVGATLVLDTQSRVTNEDGMVDFEPFYDKPTSYTLIYSTDTITGSLDEFDKNNILDVKNRSTHSDHSHDENVSILQNPAITWAITAIILLGIVAISFVLYKVLKTRLSISFRQSPKYKLALISLMLVSFTLSLLPVYFLNKESTFDPLTQAQGDTPMVRDSSLPAPTNVKAYGDDRVATITWDINNEIAQAEGIVGYLVRWGEKNGNTFTDSKQTVYKATQIQPLKENTEYIVSVQSVKGNRKAGGNNIMVAQGPVSDPVSISVTSSNSRVNAMRNRLTGFFDDFNIPMGNLDEKKWNTAYSGCVEKGENGTFINSQYHAHNMIRSRVGEPYCDRGAVFNRPRAVFDVTNATEANPALIEFDFDGVAQNAALRDIWYVDFVPVNSRTDNAILDTTSHNEIFGADDLDPGNMLRLKQAANEVMFQYYPTNGNAQIIKPYYLCAAPWQGDRAALDACNPKTKTGTKYSPLPQSDHNLEPIPNVRRHWVIEYSKTKIKVFIDGVNILNLNTPAGLANSNQFYIYNTLFSYNTGKDQSFLGDRALNMTTSMLHWDNFGFSGPKSNTVTHNYLDGGNDGNTPFIGSGTKNQVIPGRKRIIKIPDPIQTPLKARVHFTLNKLSYGEYSWKSSDHILVNGKKYDYVDPQTKTRKNYSPLSGSNLWLSDVIEINPADLVQGNNTLDLNIDTDLINLHIELDYPSNTTKPYTQPQNIFGAAKFNPAIMPPITKDSRPVDYYLFMEQDLGLKVPVSSFDGETPVVTTTTIVTPTSTSTIAPTTTSTISPTTSATVTTTRVPQTPTNTPTSTRVPQTPTPTSTRVPQTPTSTNNPTSSPTQTNIPTNTPTSTRVPQSPTPTSTRVPQTPTGTNNPTAQPTQTISPTNSPTASTTRTPTPTPNNETEKLAKENEMIGYAIIGLLILIAIGLVGLVIWTALSKRK